MSEITTERLILRPIKWKDINDYNEYAVLEEVGYPSGWQPHKTRMDTLSAISRIKNAQGIHFAVEFEGKMIGTCSLQEDDKRKDLPSLMLGYSLNPRFHNKGLGTELAKALVGYAFERNILTVAAYCFPENGPSKRVLIKSGFSYEGTLKKSYKQYDGSLKDVECYLITREAYEKA